MSEILIAGRSIRLSLNVGMGTVKHIYIYLYSYELVNIISILA